VLFPAKEKDHPLDPKAGLDVCGKHESHVRGFQTRGYGMSTTVFWVVETCSVLAVLPTSRRLLAASIISEIALRRYNPQDSRLQKILTCLELNSGRPALRPQQSKLFIRIQVMLSTCFYLSNLSTYLFICLSVSVFNVVAGWI
jgi:hypothetical protein